MTRRFTEQEDQYLIATYHTTTLVDQAMHLGRYRQVVAKRRARLRSHGHITTPQHQPRQSWTETEDAYLIETQRTQTIEEQAAHLGRTRTAITRRRWRLRREGRISDGQRKHNPEWTPNADADLIRLLEEGNSVKTIAKRLGRTPGAVWQRAARVHGGVMGIRGGVMAVRQARGVAALLGVAHDRVLEWVRRGWLKSKRNGASGRTRVERLITDEMLMAFLSAREYWPLWAPGLITDPDWREWARDVRAVAGGVWLSVNEVAHRAGRTREAAMWWIRGSADVPPRLPSMRLKRQWYVWSTDLDAFLATRGTRYNRKAA